MALLELFGSVLLIHAPVESDKTTPSFLNGGCGDIGTNEALGSKVNFVPTSQRTCLFSVLCQFLKLSRRM